MAKQIVVTLAKIKDSPSNAEIVNQYQIQSGSGAVRVQAVDNIYYHLTNAETGFAPENIMTQRVGDDLHVAFEGENIANPDLIIEDYYKLAPNGHKNLLIGMHENGSFYPYVPESAQTADAVHLLAEQFAAGQALGGESFAAIVPWVAGGAAAAAGLSPAAIIGGIAGLGLVGGAIAASSNSKDKDNNDGNTPPPPPGGGTEPPPPGGGVEPPPPGGGTEPPPPGGGTNPPPGGGGGTNPPPSNNLRPSVEVTITIVPKQGDAQPGQQVATSAGTDPNPGDTLTYSIDDPNGYYAIDPQTGEVTLTQAGADHVNAGGDLPDVKVTVTDQDGLSGTDDSDITPPTTIDLPPANEAPTAVDDNYIVQEDESVVLNPLQGDSDPDGDTLTVTHINGEALTGGVQTIVVPNGKVEVDASGQLNFVPDADFRGESRFEYTISDGQGNSATAEQIITVNPVNDAPMGQDKTFNNVAAASETTLKLGDFGFTDPKDNPQNALKEVILEKPSAGELLVNGVEITGQTKVSRADIEDGKVVYVAPRSRPAAVQTIKFKVVDDGGTTNGGQDTAQDWNTLSFDVKPIVALSANRFEGNEGEQITYTVSINVKSDKDVVVDLNLIMGPGSGYSADGDDIVSSVVGGKVIIPKGASQTTFTIDLVQDNINDDGEIYKVEIANPVNAIRDENRYSIVSTIHDAPLPAPGVEQGAEAGSIVVTPSDQADKLVINYTDENDQPQTLTLTKDPNSGTWRSADPLPDGLVDLNPSTGVVTLKPDAVKDGSTVVATNSVGNGPMSEEGRADAGIDNKLTGTASSDAIDADMLGWNGEFYGYNDSDQADPTNFRHHADDKLYGDLHAIDELASIINGREGEQIVVSDVDTIATEHKAASTGTPDVRFQATHISYGRDPKVIDNLGTNERLNPGGKVTDESRLYRFLNANKRSDAESMVVEEGAAYAGERGLGKTTDSIIRVVGQVYFSAGKYDFSVHSDDGFRLRIDGKVAVEHDAMRPPGTSYSHTGADARHPDGFEIAEGFHTVELLYWERGNNGILEMQSKLHGSDDSTYQIMDLGTALMLQPDANLDLSQIQEFYNAGDATNPDWQIRTGDILDGGLGNDVIEGSEGRDFVFGGAGHDNLTGNGAADTFIFSTQAGNGNDVIKDFMVGEDKIALSDLLEIAGNIDPKAPNWQGKDAVREWDWDDATKTLSYTTADNQANTVRFDGLTQSYASVEEFLAQNLIK